MLQQCGHYTSTHGRQCSCGLLCGDGGPAAFSIFLPMTGSKFSSVHDDEVLDFDKSDASSSVDCTLSLGLPSTRLTEHKAFRSSATSQPPPSCLSSPSYGCDFQSHSKKPDSMAPGVTPASCAGANTIGSNLGSDPLLLARRCANCDTTSTPLWRNGPRGPKSLCNACGIRYKKEERRAAATAASPSSSGAATAAEQAIGYGYYRPAPGQLSPWSSCYTSAASKGSPSISMYEVEATDEDDVPFLAWRLNLVPPTQFPAVRDRPSLFQYN